MFTSPGEGVGCLDVHPLNKLIAFTELCLNPRIFVFKYPDMDALSELPGIVILKHYLPDCTLDNYDMYKIDPFADAFAFA